MALRKCFVLLGLGFEASGNLMSATKLFVFPKFQALKLTHLGLLALLTYLPPYLIEDGLLGFQAWAQRRRGLPHLTTGNW